MKLGRTVPELLASVDSQDISEAVLYYRLDPWGEERGDLQAGIITSMIYNTNISDSFDAKQPSDFIPNFEPEPELTQAEINAKIHYVMACLGGVKE